MKASILAISFLLLASCSSFGPAPTSACGDAGPATFFFPARSFYIPDPDPNTHYNHTLKRDAEDRQYYSESLIYLKEPTLSCGPAPADETYRFLWLRSFHADVAIRVARTADSYTLIAVTPTKRSDGSYRLRHIHRTLTAEQWASITASLTGHDFWNQPTLNDGPFSVCDPVTSMTTISPGGYDGARWIIEGRTDRYHVIDRWSDDKAGTSIGRAMLALANLGIPEEDIY
ncbi:MAG: hypothetical protein QM773_12220 [Hyphomonadaceae bacterium]